MYIYIYICIYSCPLSSLPILYLIINIKNRTRKKMRLPEKIFFQALDAFEIFQDSSPINSHWIFARKENRNSRFAFEIIILKQHHSQFLWLIGVKKVSHIICSWIHELGGGLHFFSLFFFVFFFFFICTSITIAHVSRSSTNTSCIYVCFFSFLLCRRVRRF